MNQRAYYTTHHTGSAKPQADEGPARRFGREQNPFSLSTLRISSDELIKAGKHGLPFNQNYLPTSVQEVIRSSGEVLDPTTRAYMELRYGHDFSQVRIHKNKRAAESANAVNARAYTVGRKIVFGEGEYAPHTLTGRYLLAHECAHVIQQQRGGASPSALNPSSTLEQAAVQASSALMNNDGPVHVAGASRPGLARVPLSLEQSLHPPSLSVEQLEREIGEIEGWLFTNPSSPENERLRTILCNLRNELENRQEPEGSSTVPARRAVTRRAGPARARPVRETPSVASGRASTDARQLIGQAEVLDQAAPITGDYGTYGIRSQGRTIQITQTALGQARREFRGQLSNGIRRVDSRIYGGRAGHRSLARIREDQFIVSRISDVIGGVSFPPLSIWNIPDRHLRTAQAALRGTRLRPTTTALIDADTTSAQAYRRYRDYREGTIRGAERTVTGLEVTRDVSFATAGILATVATGGTAGTLIATGITTTGSIAQQGMEVHLGLRDRIDWAGISFDAMIGLVTSRMGGRLGNSIVSRLVRNPQFATLGQRALSHLVGNLVAGRGASTLHLTARTIFDNLRGAGRPVTFEQYIDRLAAHLTDPRGIFMDLLTGEVGRRFAARTPPSSRRSSGSTTRRSRHEEATPQPTPRQRETPAPAPEPTVPARGGGELHERGVRPAPGERSMTRAEWRAQESERRWRQSVEEGFESAFEQRTRPRVTGSAEPRIAGRRVPTEPQRRLEWGEIPRRPNETTRQAITRIQRVVGRRISDFQQLRQAWTSARQMVLRNRTLTQENARHLFELTRTAFYRRVRNNPAAMEIMERAGFEFSGSSGTAPTLRGVDPNVPQGEIQMSLDHATEIRANWQRALNADNLVMEFTRPNWWREVVQSRHPALRED